MREEVERFATELQDTTRYGDTTTREIMASFALMAGETSMSLQQIEQDKRDFVPVVEARLYALKGKTRELTAEFDVLAVRKSAIIAIEPGDTVTKVAER